MLIYRTWRAEYIAIRSVNEYSAAFRPGRPNTEFYIQMLNIVLNVNLESDIELFIRSSNIELNIDRESRT